MAITNNREQNGSQGRSAPADISAADDPSRINLNALFFQASVPAKYQNLIAPALAVQKDKLHHEQKEKHDHETELAAVYQREIDRNILKLNIDGEEIEISQGDLRKVMQHRVHDLDEQKRALQKSGKNPEEVKRLDKLIQQYQPVIDDLQKQKADPATMQAVRDLTKQDPELKPAIKAQAALNADTGASMADNKRNSYAAQFFQEQTIAAQPLKEAFAKGAAPVAPATEPPPPAAPVAVERKQQKSVNDFSSFGA
jgi:hypothetical protein